MFEKLKRKLLRKLYNECYVTHVTYAHIWAPHGLIVSENIKYYEYSTVISKYDELFHKNRYYIILFSENDTYYKDNRIKSYNRTRIDYNPFTLEQSTVIKIPFGIREELHIEDREDDIEINIMTEILLDRLDIHHKVYEFKLK